MHRACFIYSLIMMAASTSVSADNVKRIQKADGSVEFSNVAGAGQQTVIYKSQTGEGYVFSDQKPHHGSFEVLKFSCYACNPDSTINWHTISLNQVSYVSEVQRIADKYNVDPALVRAVIHAESAFNSKAMSKKGAQGLMQLMPGTAKDLGVINALNPGENIEGGVKYLAKLLSLFDGDIKLATAAYNAGPNAVKKYNGIPPYSETKVYVERVGILHQRYQRES
ncbi:lytic transglycosylase domain-containing protein [Methylophaga sp.]|uniref:lytic transglycosylase domain-containing protein n=1 Tax=Methylophaga sp. TaxID=2024840 RepID=UPI003F69D211